MFPAAHLTLTEDGTGLTPFHIALEIKVLLQELEVPQASSPARKADLAVVVQSYVCTSYLSKYELLLLLFYLLEIVCPPKHLSFCKAEESEAHPRYLVVVLVFF